MKKYFLVINENKCGPYLFSDLHSVEFDKNTLVWHSGLVDWTKAENIEELLKILEKSSPPIPKKDIKANNITLESPISVNLNKEKKSKMDIEEKKRYAVKKVISELGVLLMIFIGAVFFAFISYLIVSNMNKPELLSEESQQKFNYELS